MKKKSYDFFDIMFDWFSDSDIFDIEDSNLRNYHKKCANISNKMYQFINHRVHPKSRRSLIEIIDERNNTISEYYERENKIYYKNGFLQGMYITLSMLYYTKNKLNK